MPVRPSQPQRPHRLLAFALQLAILLVAAPLLAQAPVASAEVADVAGQWSGAIEIPGTSLEVQVDLVAPSQEGGDWSGTIDIPAQNSEDLPLEAISVEGAAVSFRISGVPGEPTFDGELSESGDEGAEGHEIRGTFTQGGGEMPFHLARGEMEDDLPDPTEALADLGEVIERGMDLLDVPGIAVAVVTPDEVVWSRGFGLRDVEAELPVTPETVFAIGSSTKAFTTTVLATLVDEGKIDWDEPVRTYLPDFRLADPYATERLTVRDLVTHRSGLPRHDLVWYGSERTRREMYESLEHLEFSEDLRTRFQYQNLMYLVAGVLIEEVSGETWEEAVRTQIFEPLGMDDSVIASFEGQGDVARGYRWEEAEEGDEGEEDGETGDGEESEGSYEVMPYRVIESVGPAGSINSNVTDMARWVQLQLGDGTFGDDETRVVESPSLAQLHAPQMIVASGGGGSQLVDPSMSPYMLYGMGWFIQPYRGLHLVQHGGNIDGFSALVAFLPQEDRGIVVLTNKNGTPLPLLVVLSAVDRLAGLEPVDWVGRLELLMDQAEAAEDDDSDEGDEDDEGDEEGEDDGEAERVEGTEPAHALADYLGTYEHPAYGAIQITMPEDGEGDDDGDLAMALNGLDGSLEHWHYEVFNLAGTPLGDLKFEFDTGLDGSVEAVEATLEASVAPIRFVKKAPERLSDPEFLARLEGRYQIPGQVLTVVLRGETLTAHVPGQPTYDLTPVKDLEFALDGLEGFKVRFELDEDGSGPASAATLIQPNGTLRAERVEDGDADAGD